jgi:hypothetical protein
VGRAGAAGPPGWPTGEVAWGIGGSEKEVGAGTAGMVGIWTVGSGAMPPPGCGDCWITTPPPVESGTVGSGGDGGAAPVAGKGLGLAAWPTTVVGDPSGGGGVGAAGPPGPPRQAETSAPLVSSAATS